jgi:hypothetical protein
LKAAEKVTRSRQSMLLLGRREPCMKIDKQVPQGKQIHLEPARMESLTERANHLFRYKTVEIFYCREMSIGIAAREFNGSGHSLQECSKVLLELGGI